MLQGPDGYVLKRWYMPVACAIASSECLALRRGLRESLFAVCDSRFPETPKPLSEGLNLKLQWDLHDDFEVDALIKWFRSLWALDTLTLTPQRSFISELRAGLRVWIRVCRV